MRVKMTAWLPIVGSLLAIQACAADDQNPSSNDNTSGGTIGSAGTGSPGSSGSASAGHPGAAGSSGGGSPAAAGSNAGGSGTGGSGTAGSGTSGSSTGGSGTAGSGTAGSGTAGSGTAGSSNMPGDKGEMLPPHVMTWYTFQDNTPPNSSISSSGRELKAYVTVAVPFTELSDFGGTLNYGDKLYLKFLDGRKMPNGKNHTGWVEIADFCGDEMNDAYCYQKVGGKKYPNVDLYIGDFTKSGMAPNNAGDDCEGPAGSGQELTDLSVGDPGSDWVGDYGVASLGNGKCGDEKVAMQQQGPVDVCWHYTPPDEEDIYCADCSDTSCAKPFP